MYSSPRRIRARTSQVYSNACAFLVLVLFLPTYLPLPFLFSSCVAYSSSSRPSTFTPRVCAQNCQVHGCTIIAFPLMEEDV